MEPTARGTRRLMGREPHFQLWNVDDPEAAPEGWARAFLTGFGSLKDHDAVAVDDDDAVMLRLVQGDAVSGVIDFKRSEVERAELLDDDRLEVVLTGVLLGIYVGD